MYICSLVLVCHEIVLTEITCKFKLSIKKHFIDTNK